MRALCCLVLGLFVVSPSRAQIGISTGEAVGVIVGGIVVVTGAAVGVSYALSKGVAEGCVVEADGKKTLVESNKKVYAVLDGGPSLPVGDHVKLKGHKSGTKSAPSIQVEKVLKVYGP